MRQQESSFIDDWQKNWKIMAGLAQIMAFPVDIFATKIGTFGSRYLGLFAVAGCFWPLLFSVFCGPHPRLGDLYYFWLLSLALLLVHRAVGILRRFQGDDCHSRYWGRSWLQRGSGLRADRKARALDVVLVFGLGAILAALGSGPLGAFLMVSAVAKLFNDGLEFHAVESRLQEMADARIEQESYGAMYRERYR